MIKHKKRDVCICACFLFFAISNSMEPKKFFGFGKDKHTKASQENSVVERIDPNELPLLEGSIVLWKQNDNAFYAVRLGERLANTSSYKIYKTENAGIICSATDLYRYKQPH